MRPDPPTRSTSVPPGGPAAGSVASGTWDAAQYLRFERERTQPAIDLLRRVELERPDRLVDLGCGPGNSTQLLGQRWSGAHVTGVDRSAEMLAAARTRAPAFEWVSADLASWTAPAPFDLVFSNAALQWVPDHGRLIPRLWESVAPSGVLAFQVPARSEPAPPWIAAWESVAVREFPRSPPIDPVGRTVRPLEEYYDMLAPRADAVAVWETEYRHVLDGPGAVVEWVEGTGLRPWLQSLPDDAARGRFRRAYLPEIERGYPVRPDGRVLFPFLRRFVVAERPG